METQSLLDTWLASKRKPLVFEGLNPRSALALLQERASILRLLIKAGVVQIEGEPLATEPLLRNVEDLISQIEKR